MEAAVFILSLVDCCALIFLSVYFIITLSDLECDYINARACCSKLNKWVIPELIAQALPTVLMLVSMHWFVLLLNLPVAAWNIYRYSCTRISTHYFQIKSCTSRFGQLLLILFEKVVLQIVPFIVNKLRGRYLCASVELVFTFGILACLQYHQHICGSFAFTMFCRLFSNNNNNNIPYASIGLIIYYLCIIFKSIQLIIWLWQEHF
ncbi:protein cornichon homolog 4 isoform X1 [Danio rerio]|uniref:Protein cornichon homolog 4 isoform X1 n=1 Tax=Danio rerio TaxID=7955 RepID=A0AC58HIK0_DANRE